MRLLNFTNRRSIQKVDGGRDRKWILIVGVKGVLWEPFFLQRAIFKE